MIKKLFLTIVSFSLTVTVPGHSVALAAGTTSLSSSSTTAQIVNKKASEVKFAMQFDDKNRVKRIYDQSGIQLDVNDYYVHRFSLGSSKVYLTLTNQATQQVKLSLSSVVIGTQYVEKTTTEGTPSGDISKIPCLEKEEAPSLKKCIDNINKKLPTVIKTIDPLSPIMLPSKDNSLLEITVAPGEIIRFSINQTFWDESFRNNEWAKKIQSDDLQTLINNASVITENGKLPLNVALTDISTGKKIADFSVEFEVMKFADERKFVPLNEIFGL